MFTQIDVLKLCDLIKTEIVPTVIINIVWSKFKVNGLMVYKSPVWNVMQIIHQPSSCYVQQSYGQKDTVILIRKQQDMNTPKQHFMQ
jgi:hypothetical protein